MTDNDFDKERDRMDDLVMKYAGINIKRFYGLDESVYRAGALPTKSKELMGLVASLVLRCDDCITYHLKRCHGEGIDDAELDEALAIGLVAGGSVVIPHLRRAYNTWDELQRGEKGS